MEEIGPSGVGFGSDISNEIGDDGVVSRWYFGNKRRHG